MSTGFSQAAASPWWPHSCVFPSWGPLCSLFFILRGFSSLIKSHILSSHGPSSGIKRLPFAEAHDSKRMRWKPRGGLKQSSRRDLASLPLLSIKAHRRAIPHSRGGAPGSPFGWKERQSHFKKARGQARILATIFANKLPQNLKPRHSVRCRAPLGWGWGCQCPSDVISFFQRQTASKPVAGLEVTPLLQLFNKLGILWGPSAKLDNTKARVSQT